MNEEWTEPESIVGKHTLKRGRDLSSECVCARVKANEQAKKL